MKEKGKMREILKLSIIVIAIIVLTVIIMLNITHEVTITRYEEHTQIQNMEIGKLFLSLLLGILIIGFMNRINQLKIHKWIKTIIMIISIALYVIFQIIWVQFCNIKPGADQSFVFGSAKRIFNHSGTSETMIRYLSYYRQNIGLVVIFEKLMWLFQNDNWNLFRYFNIVSNVFMIFGLYTIFKMISNKKGKKNRLLFFTLILGFLPISFMTTWVYGDFISLSLAIWSIVFMIKYVTIKKVHYFIFSSIMMSLAIMARSNSLIIVVALVMYLLFTIGEIKTKQEKIIRLLCVGVFIAVSIIPNKMVISNFSKKYQLLDGKEKSFALYLYMGMSEGGAANGWYNDEVDDINVRRQYTEKEDNTIEKEIMEKLKERIKYLLKHPMYTLRFYQDKILSMWAEPTMASEVYNTQRGVEPTDNKLFVLCMEGNNFEIVKLSQKIIDGIIYAGALIYVILKRKNMSYEMLLLVTIFLGGFSFHLFWEAKSRYILPYVVILIPVAVEGINELTKIIKNKRKTGKEMLLKKGERQNEENITSDSHVL